MGPCCISNLGCVQRQPFSPKVVSNLCKTQKKHRVNVQIYFFMSKMFLRESECCGAHRCVVAGADAQLD